MNSPFQKLIWVLVVLFVCAGNLYSKDLNYWATASVIWGQGAVGTEYRIDTNDFVMGTYDFVYDFYDGFDFHQGRLTLGHDSYRYGLTYRWQLSQDELAPFVGSVFKKENYFVYNSVEYRMNSVVKDVDYVRSLNKITLYYPRTFHELFRFRPYISNSLYIDWDDVGVEKDRIYLGYLFFIENVEIDVYYIPWTYGVKESNWDDQNSFGIGARFIF